MEVLGGARGFFGSPFVGFNPTRWVEVLPFTPKIKTPFVKLPNTSEFHGAVEHKYYRIVFGRLR